MVSSPDPTASPVLLAEYAALRAEVERRATIQWNVLALQLTSAGAVAALAIADTAHNMLLLIVPLSSFLLGNRYILHDHHLKLISAYISESLSPRLGGDLQWDDWKRDRLEPVTGARHWLGATGWNVIHPTRLAFEGVAALALGAAAVAASINWPDTVATVLGLVLVWCLDAAAVALLDRTFARAA